MSRRSCCLTGSAEAMEQGHAAAAWALISKKAKLSCKDKEGHTALMLGNLASNGVSRSLTA